ncbi:MAG: LCP family protein [Chloroflexota bacterium]|nr:LCP family protein [Chloroflexota bacterium]
MRSSPIAFLLGVVALVLATVVCSFVGFTAAQRVASDVSRISAPAFQISSLPTLTPIPTRAPTATPADASPATSSEPTAIVPTATLDPLAGVQLWNDPRRVTILLMGIDQRQGETGPFRTDTMILISVDPVRRTAGVLSIPRDLWVTIPGFQPNRINTANLLGDGAGLPGGGAQLAVDTVELNFGIPVNYYVMINFDVFTQVVSTLTPDGVEVCPAEEIVDDFYPDGSYGFLQIRFPAGCQRLDAERLLQYARTRHGNSDFDRAARQQEVLRAFRAELLNIGGLANVIVQIPTLWDQVATYVRTNMSLEQMLSLAQLAQDIPQDNISFGVIGPPLAITEARTNTGDQVLIPNQFEINRLLIEVFNPQAARTSAAAAGATATTGATGSTRAELRAAAQAENATIAIFNNTTIAGLAGQTRDYLVSRQVTIAEVGNTQTPTGEPTTIRVYTGMMATARYLADLLGLPEDRIVTTNDGATTADVLIVTGPDIQPLLAGQ